MNLCIFAMVSVITFIIFLTIITKMNLYDIDSHDCFGDLGINSPWQVCSFGPSLIRRQVQFCAHFKTIPAWTPSNQQGLFKYRRVEYKLLHLKGTCSPSVDTKLAHAWRLRGIWRSWREPRYLPWESYLDQKVNSKNSAYKFGIQINLRITNVPVHLPMHIVVTRSANQDKFTLISDCTRSVSTIFKFKLDPTCENLQILSAIKSNIILETHSSQFHQLCWICPRQK